MNPILLAILSVVVIGVICAVMLVIASKVMAVKTDERMVALRAALPGANCGACGYAGCDGYAAALADSSDERTNLCIPGGDAVSRDLSDILGVDFSDVVEKVAVVHCCGDNASTSEKMSYDGIKTCQASKQFFGGKNACSYGCIGFGDCAVACPQNAITIIDGLARVDTTVCTGCGICAGVCPNKIISVEPDVIHQVIMCSNHDKGAVARKLCKNACIACKKCERGCPTGAITVVDNLPIIDYDKCILCGKCAQECPVHCISTADYKGINTLAQEKVQ